MFGGYASENTIVVQFAFLFLLFGVLIETFLEYCNLHQVVFAFLCFFIKCFEFIYYLFTLFMLIHMDFGFNMQRVSSTKGGSREFLSLHPGFRHRASFSLNFGSSKLATLVAADPTPRIRPRITGSVPPPPTDGRGPAAMGPGVPPPHRGAAGGAGGAHAGLRPGPRQGERRHPQRLPRGTPRPPGVPPHPPSACGTPPCVGSSTVSKSTLGKGEPFPEGPPQRTLRVSHSRRGGGVQLFPSHIVSPVNAVIQPSTVQDTG